MVQYPYGNNDRIDNATLQVLSHSLKHTRKYPYNLQDQHWVQIQVSTILHIYIQGSQAYMAYKMCLMSPY